MSEGSGAPVPTGEMGFDGELYDWFSEFREEVLDDQEVRDFWTTMYEVRLVYDPPNDNHGEQEVCGPVPADFGRWSDGFIQVFDADFKSTYERIDDRTVKIEMTYDEHGNESWEVRDIANDRLYGELAEFEVLDYV